MQTKAQKRAWYARNKDRVNAARRAVTGERLERKKARNRAWYAGMNPGQKRGGQMYMRVYGLRKRFKISLVKWLAIFSQQGECCVCCKRKDPGGKHWHTDHDHQTGRIRGILCRMCNAVLGMLGDTLPAVEESSMRFTAYLKGAEPVWKDGIEGGDLLVWEPA